jgi:anti-anti-sigma factor
MEQLNVTVEPSDHQTRVHPRGEIDIATAEHFESVLDASLQQADVTRLEMDMSEVSFMDCSGLRVLIHVKERLRKEGGTLVLTELTPMVGRLLMIAGFDEHMDEIDVLPDRPQRSL